MEICVICAIHTIIVYYESIDTLVHKQHQGVAIVGQFLLCILFEFTVIVYPTLFKAFEHSLLQ